MDERRQMSSINGTSSGRSGGIVSKSINKLLSRLPMWTRLNAVTNTFFHSK